MIMIIIIIIILPYYQCLCSEPASDPDTLQTPAKIRYNCGCLFQD